MIILSDTVRIQPTPSACNNHHQQQHHIPSQSCAAISSPPYVIMTFRHTLITASTAVVPAVATNRLPRPRSPFSSCPQPWRCCSRPARATQREVRSPSPPSLSCCLLSPRSCRSPSSRPRRAEAQLKLSSLHWILYTYIEAFTRTFLGLYSVAQASFINIDM